MWAEGLEKWLDRKNTKIQFPFDMLVATNWKT